MQNGDHRGCDPFRGKASRLSTWALGRFGARNASYDLSSELLNPTDSWSGNVCAGVGDYLKGKWRDGFPYLIPVGSPGGYSVGEVLYTLRYAKNTCIYSWLFV